MSEAVDLLLFQLRAAELPEPVLEFRFRPPRKWRADLAWPDAMLLVEVDGGSWVGGRHVSGVGFEADLEKINAAQIAGYRVLRFTPRMVRDGVALEMIERIVG